MSDEALRLARRESDALVGGDPSEMGRAVREAHRIGYEEVLKVIHGAKGDIQQILSMSGLPEGEQYRIELLLRMRSQVEAVRLAYKPLPGEGPAPSVKSILDSIERTITPEQARFLLNNEEIHQLTLNIIPPRNDQLWKEALIDASQTMEEFQTPIMMYSDLVRWNINHQAARGKWRFVIGEGNRTFDRPTWDEAQLNLRQRRKNFRARLPEGMSSPDAPAYAAMMEKSLREGKPIDCRYEGDSTEPGANVEAWQYTVLNETDSEGDKDQRSSGLVGVGAWDDDAREVNLDADDLQIPNEYARFRFAVMGDIEI